MRILVAALAVLALTCWPAGATIHEMLDDDVDDVRLVHQVSDRPEVEAARVRLYAFERSLLGLRERDFATMFGKARKRAAKEYAIPVAQHRGLAFPGSMGFPDSAFYVTPNVGALEVWYLGDRPYAVIAYFPVDSTFPKLTKDNLARRLAWDAERFERLNAYVTGRLELAFPWVVDRDELARLTAGDFETNAGRKLAAWIASGQALGYRYEHKPGSDDWKWFDANGRLVREASRAPGTKNDPVEFIWYRPTGGRLREEWFDYQTGELTSRRWTGPTGNIRYESRGSWCWYGKDGKPARLEWDDNGDGIPDWYVTADDGIRHCADLEAMQKRKPLPVPESWAVHPELIPPASRVSDQPDLRVPVRRREAVAGGPDVVEPADPAPAGDEHRKWAWWVVPSGLAMAGLVAVASLRRARGMGRR